jgi:hypothetical protein
LHFAFPLTLRSFQRLRVAFPHACFKSKFLELHDFLPPSWPSFLVLRSYAPTTIEETGVFMFV